MDIEASRRALNRLGLKTIHIIPRRFLRWPDNNFCDLLFGLGPCYQSAMVGFFGGWFQAHNYPIDDRRSLTAISEMQRSGDQRSGPSQVWLLGHQERPVGTQCEFRGFGGSERGVGASLGRASGVFGRDEQTDRDRSVQNGDNENAPIGDGGPLIPFLLGVGLFYGGARPEYLYWGWLDNDRKGRWGWVGLACSVAIMGAGLILMFFVAPAYACCA